MEAVLVTPPDHLPPGYPLPDRRDTRYDAIWTRAFQIHAIRCPSNRQGTIMPVFGRDNYCDCYERAFRESPFAGAFDPRSTRKRFRTIG